MKQILIIPNLNTIAESLDLAKEYSLGFEYNDFFSPAVLDNEEHCLAIEKSYKQHSLPCFCTMHGAFFDVIPFSPDEKIKEISLYRIEQSISAAQRMNASAVVFHTNYNPFLNSEAYINSWLDTNTIIWSDILSQHSDISIYLENMFDTVPDLMCELSARLNRFENYGVCLDYAHAAISMIKPYIWAERLGKYVKHVHLNDNDLVSDLHQPWGSGKIDKNMFYESYEKHLSGASILIETSNYIDQRTSLEVLASDGFIK